MSQTITRLLTANLVKLRALRLEFDNSTQGNRHSFVWNSNKSVDYSGQLISIGTVRNETESIAFTPVATDLSVSLTNLGAGGRSNSSGFWDQDWSTFALKPLYGILARVSAAVWDDSIAGWSAWQPLFTGIVDDLQTSTPQPVAGSTVSGGRAEMLVAGITSVLANESAELVKDGDSFYPQMPIDRGIKLYLTQKDRHVTAYANNVSVSVVSRSGTSVVLQRTDSGEWSDDETGAHPYGVLAGYVWCITTGTYAGQPFVIASSSGTGNTITVNLGNSSPIVNPGDAGYITGYCYPYLDLSVGGTQTSFSAFHELAGMDIQPVTRIPTMDGRWVLSSWGTPPEDGTVGLCEAIAHDGSYVWLGIGSTLYRFSETSGYTKVVTLTGGLQWRRLMWWSLTGYVYAFAWSDNDASPERAMYVYRVHPGTAEATNQTWSTAQAVSNEQHMLPCDLAYRHSLTGWNAVGLPQTSYSAAIGGIRVQNTIVPGTEDNKQVNLPIFVPQSVRIVDTESVNTTNSYRTSRLGFMLDNQVVQWPQSPVTHEAAPIGTTNDWTCLSLWADSLYNLVFARFAAQYSIGGSYHLLHATNAGTATDAIFFWARDYAASKLYLKSVNSLGAISAVCTFTGQEALHGPAALWQGNNGSALYAAFNVHGDEMTGSTGTTQIRVYSILLSTLTPSLAWQSSTSVVDDTTYLFVGACGANGRQSVGCLMTGGGVTEGTLNAATPRHRFLLVQGIEGNAFWTNLTGNTLMQSRTPWTHFKQDANGDAWFSHYGDNTLWKATSAAWGEVTGKLRSVVPGDRTLASDLCFTSEAQPRTIGVSAGDLPRLFSSSTPPTGKNFWWQYAPWFAPRVPGLWHRGSRLRAISDLVQLAQYTFSVDASAVLHVKARQTLSPVGTLSNGELVAVTKTRPRDQHFTRVTAKSYVGVIGDASAPTYQSVNIDDAGNPIDGRAFNGGITVRPGSAATKSIRLVCVVGSTRTAEDSSAPPVTNTWWRIFCPTASPQWADDGSAFQYPGGWWNLPAGDGTATHDVWLKLEDATGSGITPVGFSVGDSITLEIPGLQAQESQSGMVTIPNVAAERDYRVNTYPIDNPFTPEGMEVDIALSLLTPLSTLPTLVVADARLRYDIGAGDAVTVAYNPLNINMTGYVQRIAHMMPAPEGGRDTQSQIEVRSWNPAVAAPAQAQPQPVPPQGEPA